MSQNLMTKTTCGNIKLKNRVYSEIQRIILTVRKQVPNSIQIRPAVQRGHVLTNFFIQTINYPARQIKHSFKLVSVEIAPQH